MPDQKYVTCVPIQKVKNCVAWTTE